MTTSEHISLEAAETFCKASLIGLRFLQLCKPDRPDAEDDIQAVEKAPPDEVPTRVEELFRKASATWGAAFSPAQVFRIPNLAAEEPFGPDWPVLPREDAKRIWDDIGQRTYQSGYEAFQDAAKTWNVPLAPDEVRDIDITPAVGLLVAGPSALAVAVRAFGQNQQLDWARQVAVVASRPEMRHLAGLAGPFVWSSRPTRLLSPHEANAAVASPAAAVFFKGHRADEILVSDDAERDAREFAERARDGDSHP